MVYVVNRMCMKMVDHSEFDKLFKYRRARKKKYVYVKIAKYYDTYPDHVKYYLLNVNKYGYFKDLLYLMEVSKSWDLTSLIYKILINKLDDDLDKYNRGKKISTLCKWLPREKSHFDKTLNFVDIFSEIYFGNIVNVKKWLMKNSYCFHGGFRLRKKYRKIITMLNKHINTTEIYLSSKEHNKIEFKNVGPQCLKNNFIKFTQLDETKDKINTFLFNKFSKLSANGLVKKMSNDKTSDYELELLNKAWDNVSNKNIMLSLDNDYSAILLDLSDDIIQDKNIFNTILCQTLLQFKFNNKLTGIYINCYKKRFITLGDKLTTSEKIKKIINNAGTFRKINANDIDGEILCFTNKKQYCMKTKYFSINNLVLTTRKKKNITYVNIAKKQQSYTHILLVLFIVLFLFIKN